MRRLATLAAASLLSTLALAGCANDDEQPGTATDRDLEVEDLSPGVNPEGFDAGSGEAPTRCSDLSPDADGRYPVGEAGFVTVTLDEDGRAVELQQVEPADGWEYEVAEADDIQVDVRFAPAGSSSAAVALVATLGNDAAGTDLAPEIRVEFCEDVA